MTINVSIEDNKKEGFLNKSTLQHGMVIRSEETGSVFLVINKDATNDLYLVRIFSKNNQNSSIKIYLDIYPLKTMDSDIRYKELKGMDIKIIV